MWSKATAKDLFVKQKSLSAEVQLWHPQKRRPLQCGVCRAYRYATAVIVLNLAPYLLKRTDSPKLKLKYKPVTMKRSLIFPAVSY